ncbi:hypothetical protein CHS0354_006297 [Potamilus streckersoni]|uniref:Uncharacterized protein n=1 Tax=Potamilus streckersoni TaxID=2493646 RepID=A0AAE0S5C8_9BIVA|nr:hypothetical protein CHS0354_006297 [Potamilus streckersoni]
MSVMGMRGIKEIDFDNIGLIIIVSATRSECCFHSEHLRHMMRHPQGLHMHQACAGGKKRFRSSAHYTDSAPDNGQFNMTWLSMWTPKISPSMAHMLDLKLILARFTKQKPVFQAKPHFHAVYCCGSCHQRRGESPPILAANILDTSSGCFNWLTNVLLKRETNTCLRSTKTWTVARRSR